MPLLHFFVAKLIRSNGKNSAQLSLRFKYGSSAKADELSASEPVLSAFCFPLGAESVTPKERLASEEYSFTLTHGDGSRFQGFCRVVLPPAPKVGSKLRYPWVLCIMSEFPWNAFYFMVLQTVEQLLRVDEALDTDLPELPPSSMAGTLLEDLGFQLSPDPAPGSIIKVPLPNAAGLLGVSPILTLRSHGPSLYKDDWIELPVPTDCGNGKLNCGISLARLLWHVPVSSMLTLLSAMLLEQRIVMTSTSRDTLTAAVQAAAALLYPFKYHHIFLPLLPKMLKDYLQAPMPFLVGLPDQMLGILKGMHGIDEVTLVDLDQGKVYPNWKPGTPAASHDDTSLLPWRDELEAALTAAYSTLKSPTEYEQSSPYIAGIMQEYFLKLVGSYRSFIHEDTPVLNAYFATHFQAASGGSATGAAAAPPASPAPRRESRRSSRAEQQDSGIKGHGYVFEHLAFVAHHRRNDKARSFLAKFRHSQMYEMFVQERLQLASQQYVTDDPFEARLVLYQERQLSAAIRLGPRPAPQPSGKLAGIFRKHHRSGSVEVLPEAANSSDAIMRRITTEPELQGKQPSPASFFEVDVDLDFLDTAELRMELRMEPDSPVTKGNRSLSKTSAPLGGMGRVGLPQLHAVSVQPPPSSLSRGESEPLDSLSASSAAHPGGASVAVSPPMKIEQRPGAQQQQQQPVMPQQPVMHEQAAVHQSPVAQQQPAATPSSSSYAPAVAAALPHQKQGGVAMSLQSGKKQLEATKDAVKEMWSQATQGMRRSVGGNAAPGPVRRPQSMSGTADESGQDALGEGVTMLAPPPSSTSPLDYMRPKSAKPAGQEDGKPRTSLLQRYLPHGAVGVGAGLVQSLLEGSKLKQPPAPVRPLNIPQQLQTQRTQPPRPVQEGWDPFGLSFR